MRPNKQLAELAQSLWSPTLQDHKYRRGVVTLVTGSEDYPGAGVLSSAAAFRAGAGLVRYLGSEPAKTAILADYPEVVFQSGGGDAAVIGCGWAQSLKEEAKKVAAETPVAVVDAGALFLPQLWKDVPLKVLTPHLGEAARMLERDVQWVQEHPEDAALSLAERYQSVVLLKAGTTYVAQPSRVLSFEAFTTWGGCAGAGDVLAGTVGAIMARASKIGLTCASDPDLDSVFALAHLAALIHSEAALKASGQQGVNYRGRPIVAGDIIDCLPDVIAAFGY